MKRRKLTLVNVEPRQDSEPTHSAELDNETRIAQLQLQKHKQKLETHQRLLKEHQALVEHHQAKVEELQNRLNPPQESKPKPALNVPGILLELLSQPPQTRTAMHRWLLEPPQKKTNTIRYGRNIPLPLSSEMVRWLNWIEARKE